MNPQPLEPRLCEELKNALERGLTSGELMPPAQIAEHTKVFRGRFGPDVLRGLDGEELLRLMHGRQDSSSRCLDYWLEFKNDDEFAGYRFGGIGGGTALKFGVYQRQSDGAWITGSNTQQQIVSVPDAIKIARQQRDELLAGDKVLAEFGATDISDDAYFRLQTEMEKAAPNLSQDGWAHKYWFLIYPDRLDDYHSPRYQRFHLLKLLQLPPDRVGILDWAAPRFICAGRFIAVARQFEVPVTTLDTVLNQRHGSIHRYWRIGTTIGDTGESQWSIMRDGGFVSIGWSTHVPNLSNLIGQEKSAAKDQIRKWLLPRYSDSPATATKKSGEILNFAQTMAENDFVLACEGRQVLGVGRVRGPYDYDGNLEFPHKRPIEWLLLDQWQMPTQEGLRTTIHEIGKYADNLLELERRVFNRDRAPHTVSEPSANKLRAATHLPALDRIAARIDNILRRKSQVVLYGPPGTGKTHHAVRVAKELAARQVFRKTFDSLAKTEAMEIGPPGLVHVCTFHPGFGYEDFIEGLRAETVNGQLTFERRDGTFKRLCEDARHNDRPFYLVIDEINRGDVPRIFGELMTVVEHDKRGTPITLPLSGKSFIVPRNVFLIGTMNTADRSISLLDTALRRRFGFVELMPDSSALGGRTAGGLPLGPWLDALNARLRQHLKRDARNLQIGHAYLMTSPITSVAEFARVLRDDIIPLLEEYCYDDFRALKDILGNGLVDAEGGRIREELFEPNKEEDLIQALSFEEMQSLALAQGLAADEPVAEEPEPTAEAENASETAA
jgi:5-methylcytosine-specific restriction protein B